MSLPAYVAPVLASGGPVAFVLVISRYASQVARAVVMLLASVVAIKTSDGKRRAACLKILDKVTRRDAGPPGPDQPPRRRAIGRGRSAR